MNQICIIAIQLVCFIISLVTYINAMEDSFLYLPSYEVVQQFAAELKNPEQFTQLWSSQDEFVEGEKKCFSYGSVTILLEELEFIDRGIESSTGTRLFETHPDDDMEAIAKKIVTVFYKNIADFDFFRADVKHLLDSLEKKELIDTLIDIKQVLPNFVDLNRYELLGLVEEIKKKSTMEGQLKQGLFFLDQFYQKRIKLFEDALEKEQSESDRKVNELAAQYEVALAKEQNEFDQKCNDLAESYQEAFAEYEKEINALTEIQAQQKESYEKEIAGLILIKEKQKELNECLQETINHNLEELTSVRTELACAREKIECFKKQNEEQIDELNFLKSLYENSKNQNNITNHIKKNSLPYLSHQCLIKGLMFSNLILMIGLVLSVLYHKKVAA